jgi:hypothetical protein
LKVELAVAAVFKKCSNCPAKITVQIGSILPVSWAMKLDQLVDA